MEIGLTDRKGIKKNVVEGKSHRLFGEGACERKRRKEKKNRRKRTNSLLLYN